MSIMMAYFMAIDQQVKIVSVKEQTNQFARLLLGLRSPRVAEL